MNPRPRGHNERSEGDLLREKLATRLRIQPEEHPEQAPTEPLSYSETLTSIEERINHNAKVIGRTYEHQSGVEGLQYGFTQTFIDVSSGFASQLELARNKDDPSTVSLYTNALAELELLSAVERVMSEPNFEHIDAQTFMGDIFSKEPEFTANIQGITATMLAGTEEQTVRVTHATWNFDPNGIRLSVRYQNEVTGKESYSQISMDFHGRKNPKHGDKEQAALDLKGDTLDRAIRDMEITEELSEEQRQQYNDYHRYLYIDPLIKDNETFEKIKTARLKHFRQSEREAKQLAKTRNKLAG